MRMYPGTSPVPSHWFFENCIVPILGRIYVSTLIPPTKHKNPKKNSYFYITQLTIRFNFFPLKQDHIHACNEQVTTPRLIEHGE